MKVLIVSPTLGTYGGIDAFVLTLAAFLHRQPGMEVRVCFRKVEGYREDEAFQRICRESGLSISFVSKGSRELWRAIGWADIVHGQNTSPDTVFFSRLRWKPVVLTVHNYRMGRKSLGAWLWYQAAQAAQARWYNSNFVWKTWEGGKKWRGSERVPTVSNLPSGTIPPGERQGFIFVGRWIENKGLENLVRAYASARLDRERWPLTLMGDGPLRDSVLSIIRQTGLENIRTPGFVNEERKAEELRKAKWLVAPPHTNEDMGLTPLEARSVGVPCIVTRDGGLPEAAGSQALLSEPGDEAGLRANLEKASEMSEEEYRARSLATRDELKDFLKPMDFYVAQYQRILGISA